MDGHRSAHCRPPAVLTGIGADQVHTRTFPDVKTLQSRYLPETDSPVTGTRQHAITDYDALLTGAWNDCFPSLKEVAHVS